MELILPGTLIKKIISLSLGSIAGRRTRGLSCSSLLPPDHCKVFASLRLTASGYTSLLAQRVESCFGSSTVAIILRKCEVYVDDTSNPRLCRSCLITSFTPCCHSLCPYSYSHREQNTTERIKRRILNINCFCVIMNIFH